MGFDQLFMPAVPPEQRQSDAPFWRPLGCELGEIAERMRDQGIAFGYHNHHWELAPKDGAKTALELIFEAAAGSPLAWQVDLAWLVRGGADPKKWMQRYGDRVVSAHVKDIAPEGQNEDQDGWADIGTGVLDWRDLWQAAGRPPGRRARGGWWSSMTSPLILRRPRVPATLSSAAWEFNRSMERIDIGIIGCGNISHSYLKGAARSEMVRVRSVADLQMEAAREKAAQYGVQVVTVDRLLADPDIQIVINLTVPLAHAQVSLQIVEAAKHVYSEKPLVTRLSEAEALMLAAAAKGVRVGCAPDTFLGAGHQACRRAIDSGRIGRPIAGTAFFATHGMEHWHPNPEFFFKRGGGPMLDVGPYYVTQLVNLLGPVVRVAAQATMGSATRTVSSDPMKGSIIHVEVPTTVNGVLSFANGASVTITTSWDVWKHRRVPFEIYGSEGSMLVPDPNFFGGEPMLTERDGDWTTLDISPHPFGKPNRYTSAGAHVADYRIVGLLDMAAAIRDNRPHRASGKLAMHVLEVLCAFERSSAEGRHIMIETSCERPEPLRLGNGEEVFAS